LGNLPYAVNVGRVVFSSAVHGLTRSNHERVSVQNNLEL
jgi:hypothetical protein